MADCQHQLLQAVGFNRLVNCARRARLGRATFFASGPTALAWIARVDVLENDKASYSHRAMAAVVRVLRRRDVQQRLLVSRTMCATVSHGSLVFGQFLVSADRSDGRKLVCRAEPAAAGCRGTASQFATSSTRMPASGPLICCPLLAISYQLLAVSNGRCDTAIGTLAPARVVAIILHAGTAPVSRHGSFSVRESASERADAGTSVPASARAAGVLNWSFVTHPGAGLSSWTGVLQFRGGERGRHGELGR